MRLKMGQILFYRVLEKVLMAETKKSKSIGALLDQTPFHQVRTPPDQCCGAGASGAEFFLELERSRNYLFTVINIYCSQFRGC